MKIVIIGAGYVGLVSGTCFANLGHDVTLIDYDQDKIKGLKKAHIPIYEPGLEVMVKGCIASNLLNFDTDYAPIQEADVVFLAVGTPTRRGDGYADLTYVHSAVDNMASYLKEGAVVATKSTVPVGTGADLAKRLLEKTGRQISVVSNPEFLREGSAIEDFMNPDRIVIGASDDHAQKVMHNVYKAFDDRKIPLLFTNLESSEMIKYAANSFLALKVAFTNEIAQLCEKTGAHIEKVTQGIGLDPRISPHFLNPGPGYGGSCFPKDTRALCQLADFLDLPLHTIRAAMKGNDDHIDFIVNHAKATLGGDFKGKKIAIWGLTFKAGTDDVRESPSLIIAEKLSKAGAVLHVFDPEGMGPAKAQFTEATYCNSEIEAAKNADALFILTEWPQFKEVDFKKLYGEMKAPVVFDYRYCLDAEHMTSLGFSYQNLGRPQSDRNVSKLKVI